MGVDFFIHLGERYSFFLLLSFDSYLFFPHYSLMTSEGGDTTLVKNTSYRKKRKKKIEALQASKGLGNSAQRNKLLKQSVANHRLCWHWAEPAPAVRTRFIFGPSTDSRKPHLLASFSFQIIHSSISLVEKVSIRDSLHSFWERTGKTETQMSFLGKQHPPSKRPKQVCALSYSLFKLHFAPCTHKKRAAPQVQCLVLYKCQMTRIPFRRRRCGNL